MSGTPDLVISFDLDHVLVPDPIGRGVFPRVLADLARALATADTRPDTPTAEELHHLVWNEFRQRIRTRQDAIDTYDWDDIFTVVARRYGLDQPVALEPYIEEFCRQPAQIPTYPDVEPGLRRLRGLGVPLLAITNGHARFQLPVLRALGLDQFFARVVTPDQVGHSKRHPAIFQWAYRDSPGRRVHVGDSLLQDICGAHQAGLEAIWLWRDLPPNLASVPPDRRMDTCEFRQFWESILARQGLSPSDPCLYWPEQAVQDLVELTSVLGLQQQ
jgi:putative hydrolase of the HAD superfamily